MIVKDLMAKNVVSIAPNDMISHALGKMKKSGIHQLVVISGSELYGMLEIRKLATKDIDPATTKVSGYISHAPTIDANASVESAVSLLLKSGFRAIPVTESGAVVGVISETDVTKTADKFVKGLNMKAKEIAVAVDYIERKDSIAKARKIMLEKNVSRVPVVEKGGVIGVIGTIDMIRLLEGKETMEVRGSGQEKGTKEKLKLESAMAESFMHAAPTVSGEKTVKDVIGMLQSNEEIVTLNDGTIGMITPKDVLELFSFAPKKSVFVQITGMQNESIEFKVKMDYTMNEFVQKMGKMIDNIQYLYFHVNKIEKGGKRDEYFIRTRFKTPLGLFVAHASGWQPVNVIQDVVGKLEREVMKKYGKMEDLRRMKRTKERYK